MDNEYRLPHLSRLFSNPLKKHKGYDLDLSDSIILLSSPRQAALFGS